MLCRNHLGGGMNGMATSVLWIIVFLVHVSAQSATNQPIDSLKRELQQQNDQTKSSKHNLDRHTIYDGSQVLRGGSRVNPSVPYAKAVGRIGGCTGTLVSLPNAEITAVVFAAHCGGAKEFRLGEKTYGGFTCYSNRNFKERGGSSNDDVGICYSKERVNTGVHGCIDDSASNPVTAGEKLRVFGYGHPEGSHQRQLPQVSTLLSGVTTVDYVQNGKAIVAVGSAVVTPGDSGGPVIRETREAAEGGRFTIVGINSKYVLARNGKESSAFAPFTEENRDFFKRAANRFAKDNAVTAPQICGLDLGSKPTVPTVKKLTPPKALFEAAPTTVPLPQPTPPAPSSTRLTPETAPRDQTWIVEGKPSHFLPIDPRENTTAIKDVPVPAGAIGYQLTHEGGVRFVFPAHSQATPPRSVPSPKKGEAAAPRSEPPVRPVPSSPGSAARAGSPISACFVGKEEAEARRRNLPQIRDADSIIAQKVNAARQRDQMIFYDRKTMPKAWIESTGSDYGKGQIYSEGHMTNPEMMGLMGYHSDGAREFPWNQPAGTDASPQTSSDKFVIPGDSGKLARVIQRTRQSHGAKWFGTSININGPEMGWEFEEGTVFGEVLKVSGVAFEIRLRQKLAPGQWKFDVLRPFANPKELADAIRALCQKPGAPSGCARLAKETNLLASLDNPKTRVASAREFVNKEKLGYRLDPLSLNTAALDAVSPEASLHVLPDLPEDVVRELLTRTPFKSVEGIPWISGRPPGWAPTSNSDFNIFPKDYFGAFLGLKEASCVRCHSGAGKHVDNFEPNPKLGQIYAPAPNDAPRARTWYNRLPGDDGILSFHPFSLEAVAEHRPATDKSIRSCLTDSGLVY